jgi:cysteine synthase A
MSGFDITNMPGFTFCPPVYDSIIDCIGSTPCVRLNRMATEAKVVANIVLKLESMEPCSSVKDRLAKSMVLEAENRGELKPGFHVIIEPTSGNTGIGLAMVAAARGYECILVMPSTMSLERRVMLKALGATLVLTPGANGIKGSIAKANDIKGKLGDKGVILMQFENPDNPKVHRETTGPEIWQQNGGKVDILISGVGTGGTVTGCGEFLKSVNPNCKVVAVEPEESPVLQGGAHTPHKIQGIGAGFIPGVCDMTVIDKIRSVHSDKAIATARELSAKEGVCVGISGGAAVAAAIEEGILEENRGKTIVVIIASHGERYLSTPLFANYHAEAVSQEIEEVAHLL